MLVLGVLFYLNFLLILYTNAIEPKIGVK